MEKLIRETNKCSFCGDATYAKATVCPLCGHDVATGKQVPRKANPSSTKRTTPQLLNCPDCGRSVSRSAPLCPQCGRKMLKIDTSAIGWGLCNVVLGFLLLNGYLTLVVPIRFSFLVGVIFFVAGVGMVVSALFFHRVPRK